ncbi:MAG: hypothetical protein AAGJ55_12185 [Cyanobacteria bacterium J06555_12]
MTVDRIDNDKREYAPDNVRWASKRTQANNRAITVVLTDRNGICRPLTDWAKLTDQNPNTMRQRRTRGWSDVEIIEGRRQANSSSVRGSGKGYWPVSEREKKAWEDAFLRLLKRYRHHPGFTRRVFLCWMAQNRASAYSAQLERAYPDEWGEESNPECGFVEVKKDHRFALWTNCQTQIQSLVPKVQQDRHEREMMKLLSLRGGRPFDPWDIQ